MDIECSTSKISSYGYQFWQPRNVIKRKETEYNIKLCTLLIDLSDFKLFKLPNLSTFIVLAFAT